MNAFSNLSSNAKSALASELINHDRRRRLAPWVIENITIIGTKRRLERGKHSDYVRAFQVRMGTTQVLTNPSLADNRARVRCNLLYENRNREARCLVFAQHLLNVGSPFRQKVRHVRRSTPACY